MTKNVKKIMKNIKELQSEKKLWSISSDKKYVLDIEEYDEDSEYEFESSLALIKLYDCEIKRLKNILCC